MYICSIHFARNELNRSVVASEVLANLSYLKCNKYFVTTLSTLGLTIVGGCSCRKLTRRSFLAFFFSFFFYMCYS